jgi:hypothetical protein
MQTIMEDHILKIKKVCEASSSAIYVWIDPHNEGFESYIKKHSMLTLGWACSNEDLRNHLNLNNGDISLVTKQLIAGFKNDFKGNISYLQEIFGTETVQSMIQAITLFIKDFVEAYVMVFPLSHQAKSKLS